MAAELRAAEGGIFFQNPQGGIFKIFPARWVYPLPPIPDPCIQPNILSGIESSLIRFMYMYPNIYLNITVLHPIYLMK